jgi:4-diphosphocytidyl-2-C-methyl-D-erythritol kinase
VKQTPQTSQSQSLTLKAPAKINLFLKILNRRPDGYHEIESLMQKIALFDILHLSRQRDSISLSCQGRPVPEDRENLVCRAALAFFSATGIAAGVQIILEKKIPVAAGLGGGSSDAAAVLYGLNRLFSAGLDLESLMDVGLQLGADVPFFLQDCSGAVATGIGECIKKVKSISDSWILLVNPGFEVSTKWAYENFPLTYISNPYILARGREMDMNFKIASPALFEELGNDLEVVTINRFPEIGDIKKELKEAGAVTALMSGSGPTVFGLFSGKKQAQRSFEQFVKGYGDNVFLVRPYIP